jgi:hypothetical protein
MNGRIRRSIDDIVDYQSKRLLVYNSASAEYWTSEPLGKSNETSSAKNTLMAVDHMTW